MLKIDSIKHEYKGDASEVNNEEKFQKWVA
jgi:hypothetical protein